MASRLHATRSSARRPLVVWSAAAALLTAWSWTGVSAQSVPVVTSENVTLETITPVLPAAISIEFARTGDFAYVSSLTGITVLDTSEPTAPKVLGALPVANFENESMTYGERRDASGEVVQRFVLLAVDIVALEPTSPENLNIGGQQVQVVDVTDPAAPVIAGLTDDVTTSTHTAQCVDQLDCDYAYTAGSDGTFSIIDLTDIANPTQVKTVTSPAAGPDLAGLFGEGAGHYWQFDGELGWHTGSGGAAAFDVTDPLNPVVVNATNAQGREPGLNDFILHNSVRPNADRFVAGAPPSVENGNVLLVTEEDYANEGDEVVCERAGSFQTWYVPDLDGAAYRLRNPTGEVQDVGTVRNLDATNAPAEFGGGLTAPAAAFCSAHWFDYHQDGFVAQGWYGAGMRILDVRDAANITQVGYATTGATEVWDAYWVPLRDAQGVVTGEKSNVVYTADATRGVDVYTVALPTADTGTPAPGGTGGSTAAPAAGSGTTPGTAARTLPSTGAGLLLPLLAVGLLGAAVLSRRASG